MFNVDFLKELTQFSSIPSFLVHKSMAPERVQKAFRVLANKLGKEDFDSSAMLIFWFLSFIFKVHICIVKIKKSKSRGDDFILGEEIICFWKKKDVVDEIILNHSCKLDPKTGANHGYEYSVLVNYFLALLANDDLNSRADYLEALVAQQQKEIDDGMAERKVVRVLEDEPTNDREATAEKEDTTSTKNAVSKRAEELLAVLELTDDEEGIPQRHQRMNRNQDQVRAIYKNDALTNSDCDEYIDDAMNPQYESSIRKTY
jgi:hypothetical protein